MNKNDLIDAIAADADLSKASAGRALDAAIGAITGALAKGGSVSLVGFGTFSVKARAARQGRNPRTGETIQIAASNTCLLYTSPSPRDMRRSRMPSSA